MASKLRSRGIETLKQERPTTTRKKQERRDFDGSEELTIVCTIESGPTEVVLTDESCCRASSCDLGGRTGGKPSPRATSRLTFNETTTHEMPDFSPIAKRVKRHPRTNQVNYAETGYPGKTMKKKKVKKRQAPEVVVVLDSDEDSEDHTEHNNSNKSISHNDSIIILDLTSDGQCEEVLIDITHNDKDNSPDKPHPLSITTPQPRPPQKSLQTQTKTLISPPPTQPATDIVTKPAALPPHVWTSNLRGIATQSCPTIQSQQSSVVRGVTSACWTYYGQWVRPRGFLRSQPYYVAPRGRQAVHCRNVPHSFGYGNLGGIPRVPGYHCLDGRDDYMGRVYREIMKKPSVADLRQRKLIIFVDLDNWSGIFRRLPRPLPKGVFVWAFFGGHTNWRIPKQSVSFNSLVADKGFYLHPRCGTRKDAADFALCMQAGIIHAGLPTSIPFVILSGDKGFEELRQQLRQEERPRPAYFINPHTRSPETLYSMLCCLVQGRGW
ncbi:uncharacterized protein LOC134181246 isoform X2 [Corticium candelabrum]|uniref:uncharacterized protein LOC134181246 isoform X2 n=1 Tax=Corticium candelabrum TaxID=121492 RepID=UPI002E252DB0|nr:uncharacterized protein LOC134181246 isoform X2 [Corticium candelabrum]